MIISEITIPRKMRREIQSTHHPRVPNYPNSWESNDTDLRQQLRTRGWEFTDSGYFSGVFVNDAKNYILKINYRSDPGFDSFAKLTKRMKSPYLPKIEDRKYFSKNGKTYYIYYIEKLTPCPENTAKNIIALFMILKDGKNEELPPHLLSFTNEYPGLLETCKKVINFAKITSKIVDLAGNNIMFRQSNNMPVIIDPFYDIDSLK
jgi:hypothetical protein